MTIIHISDTHGFHNQVNVPECDLLLHTGDIGTRTNLDELQGFLTWFDAQPAKYKVFIAGNHDIVLDKDYAITQKNKGNVFAWLRSTDEHKMSMRLIQTYTDIIYLNNTSVNIEGLNIYGSPYSPSYHKEHWVFNADRGDEIRNIWAKIPKNTDILLTHSPVYKILDRVEDKYRESTGEDLNVGCQDLALIVKNKLLNLKLHCSGHIHNNVGCVLKNVSNTRRVLFSNGAVVDNRYKMLVAHPLIITI